MANFTFSFSPVVLSATGNPWIDPAVQLPNPYGGSAFSLPSRQNSAKGNPHRYTKFNLGQLIEVLLTPVGETGLVLDGALGGNLFGADMVESPSGTFGWSSFVGTSAYQYFTPTVKGAYLAHFRRGGSGGIIWHFMVE